jgi:hypothetical protein
MIGWLYFVICSGKYEGQITSHQKISKKQAKFHPRPTHLPQGAISNSTA